MKRSLLFTLSNIFLLSSAFATNIFDIAQEKGMPTDYASDWSQWMRIAGIMLLTSVLGGLVSFRLKRAPNQDDITEAHVILALSSTLMMMIIGSQIARAFGLMGAASIVRYRYSLKSPKEASSLIVALGIGMACGVGLYPLATISAIFVFIVVNLFDAIPNSIREKIFYPLKKSILQIRAKDKAIAMATLDKMAEEYGLKFDIHAIEVKGIERDEVQLRISVLFPHGVKKDTLTQYLMNDNITRVRWEEV